MSNASLRDRIVDAALLLAERRGWEAVRLHEVATELGITLEQIRGELREKEDIVDAWFDRADRAMLESARAGGLAALTPRERLVQLLMTWFGALRAHRRPTRQMIFNKLEFGHVHYQFAGLLRVSRTVQWLREAAQRDAVLPWRALEETALTAIYVTSFVYWMQDDSADSARTRTLLDDLLRRAERLARLVPGFRHAA